MFGFALHLELAALSTALVLICSIMLVLSQSRRKSADDAAAKVGAAQQQKDKKAAAAAAIAASHDPNKPAVRLLYGTQTGTAERFAKQLGKELSSKYGVSTLVDIVDVENYDAAERLPREKLVVLMMATYGDGEPTDNATQFYSWLEESANGREDLLQVHTLRNKRHTRTKGTCNATSMHATLV